MNDRIDLHNEFEDIFSKAQPRFIEEVLVGDKSMTDAVEVKPFEGIRDMLMWLEIQKERKDLPLKSAPDNGSAVSAINAHIESALNEIHQAELLLDDLKTEIEGCQVYDDYLALDSEVIDFNTLLSITMDEYGDEEEEDID